jgi:hypothetical protein
VKCDAELDPDCGEWVPDFPGREIHGYLISQLFSATIDPGEILEEYHRTRFPERFYNLKIGIAWADRENRLQVDEVLRCCGEEGIMECSGVECTMGVDTGRELHVVVSRPLSEWDYRRRRVVYLGVHHEFDELDHLMRRFNVYRCVIDGLPETHATREFARRWAGQVHLNFFNESQRGSPRWDHENFTVQENRTEALDASRKAIRDGEVVLPRRSPIVDLFAKHLAADAKQLEEDPDTGMQKYKYVRTGPDHFSLAFTYDCLASESERRPVIGVSIG